MTEVSLALSFLGCLAFAAFWLWMERSKPVPTDSQSEAIFGRLVAVEKLASECRDRLDALDLSGALKPRPR